MIDINSIIASIMAAITGLIPVGSSSLPALPQPAPAPPAVHGPAISGDHAQNIASDHSGVPRNQWREVEVELDHDDGRLSWEIEFDHGNWDYEYDIDANSGVIITWERDWDD